MAARPVTLSVYFEGTANTLRPVTTQVGRFFERTKALDVTHSNVEFAGERQLKMGFDGCGLTAGMPGVLFAYGLAPQCEQVLQRIKAIAAYFCTDRDGARAPDGGDASPGDCSSGPPILVNVLGLSRGGVAALMLAQRLARLPQQTLSRLVVSLVLFDPVPGNLVTTARYLDLLATVGLPGVMTTATGVMDVSYAPIDRVLALYPHEPLPAIAFHAPILPKYPTCTVVEEEAMLGCHQGALYAPVRACGHSIAAACRLSAHRLESFLAECGTVLVEEVPAAAALVSDKICLQDCEDAVAAPPQPSRRVAHSAGVYNGSVNRAPQALLLNRHHLSMLARADPEEALRRVKAAVAAPDKMPLFLLSVHRGPPAATVAATAEATARDAAEALAWLEAARPA
eukprot:scaffold232859_cov36-Tisochrysis_lutea.AAC.7